MIFWCVLLTLRLSIKKCVFERLCLNEGVIVQKEWINFSPTKLTIIVHEMPARINEMVRMQGLKIHPSWKAQNSKFKCTCDVYKR